jgi:phenylalanyl-tRNA synthetase alpha chain
MEYSNQKIAETAQLLKERLKGLEHKADILRAVELKSLFDELKLLPPEEKARFGQEVNALRQELQALTADEQDGTTPLSPIDISAPFDVNTPADKHPQLLPSQFGSKHPLMNELEIVLDIFYGMGFMAVEARELDDDYHMFGSLNFPEGHPARDDYDTFMTVEKDKEERSFIAPAHVSNMQNRLLEQNKNNLEHGKPISVVYTGRTFRNEDVDARHEHTFYQVEILYVDKGINAGNLVATFKTFLEAYYGQSLEVKSQPFYFPFTEPSFELSLSCPFCKKKGCHICSYTGWIELLGMGMVHPSVLRMGGVDPTLYTGFAGGMGLERLVMMKYGIEDIRYFGSGRLDFLRQFS